jgi:hypothetical protein
MSIELEYRDLEGFCPMETVWGGGGEEQMCEGGVRWWIGRVFRNKVRSSVTSGQIPVIYFMS